MHTETTVLHSKIGAFAAQSTVTTQTPIDPRSTQGYQKGPHVEVYWKAVTYKTVLGYGLLALAIIGAGVFLVKPNLYEAVIKKVTEKVGDLEIDPQGADQKHAKFVNLDGKVEVKKVNSVQWVVADFRTALDKGDQIKTGPDGDARITFGDGTQYTMKPGSLVVVEENSTENNKPRLGHADIHSGRVEGTGARRRCQGTTRFKQPW